MYQIINYRFFFNSLLFLFVCIFYQKRQDLLIRTEQTFDLSTLSKFLHRTLVFTEEVKNVLKSNCDEAIFCLKPWRKEIIIAQDVSENTCICTKSETGIEEIATGISRALLQTQQLREKLSPKLIKERKCLEQPGISEIYNPRATGNGGTKTRHNLSKNNKETKIDNKRSVTHVEKLTGNKNFLAINKRNVKSTMEIKKLKNSNHKSKNNSQSSSSITKTGCIEFNKRSTAASTNELKNLIQRMSSESTNCTFPNMDNSMCPVHGNVTSQVKYEHSYVAMDAVDSLNTFNIPGEMIKSLKMYHAYLNIEFSEKSIDNKKRQKMLNIFLMKFNKMDKIIQEKLIEKAYDTSLLTKFMSLFRYLFTEDINISNLDNIKQTYAELNFTWKKYNANDSINLHIWKSNAQKILLYNISDTSGWKSNGIWNFFYTRSFEGMSKARCISYKNKRQLLSFFEMIQQLQQIQYFKNVINIILEDLLPNMMFFDSKKPEYVKLYKMICILQQGLNPNIPILVQTDE